MVEKTDVVVVGGGQAGIAASEHLTKANINHIVLERARTAEHWRTMRWDSLVANGPAWHDRFPNMEFKGQHPDAFVPKEEVADYLVDEKFSKALEEKNSCIIKFFIPSLNSLNLNGITPEPIRSGTFSKSI